MQTFKCIRIEKAFPHLESLRKSKLFILPNLFFFTFLIGQFLLLEDIYYRSVDFG